MLDELTPAERREMGELRVRDAAYDAVVRLWQERKKEGLSQKELSEFLEKDPAWVSKNLSGPGNWTLRTIGAFMEALNGHIQIKVVPLEKCDEGSNFDFYKEFDRAAKNNFDEAQAIEIKAQVKNDVVLIYQHKYNKRFVVNR